jgi:hypothetical protein
MALTTADTLIPQGLRSIRFGYSRTTSNITDDYFQYGQSSDQVSSLLANLGPNAVAIGGRQFIVDTSMEPYRREAFKHKTLNAQRQSINLGNISGEGVINTEGLWRRSQVDWTMGAGQKYLDRRQNNAENRFYKSKGVDPFASPYQLSMLKTTKQIYNSSNASIYITRCGNYYYILDGNTVKECANITAATPTWTNMTFSTTGSYTVPTIIRSIHTNDALVYVATNTGIFYYLAGTTGAGSANVFIGYAKPDTTAPTPPVAGYDLVRICNESVVAASGNFLYVFPATHASWPAHGAAPSPSDLLMKNANPSWVWSDAAGGASQIYYTGYSKVNGVAGYGAVYGSGLTLNGASVPTINFPVLVLPMSPDEYPVCVEAYLNFLFLGTNKGIRMTQTLTPYDPGYNGSGALKSGPLIPNQLEPVSLPVKAIVGDGRYVWFSWSNYDSSSTGLGRLDLTTFIDNELLTPAYCSDYMVDGSGEVLSLGWELTKNVPIWTVAGKGLYTVDTTKYVANASFTTGGFTYGIPDHKIPVFFDYGFDEPDNTPSGSSTGYINADLIVEPFDSSQTREVSIQAAPGPSSEVAVPSGQSYSSEMFMVRINMHADDPSNTTAPVLFRWTLKAWPAAVSETEIMVPIQAHLVNVVDGLEVYADPYEIFSFFENLRQTQTIVQYQESTLTANVIVDGLDWQPHKRQGNYESGYEGDIIITLKTIGGYNTYPGYPTN